MGDDRSTVYSEKGTTVYRASGLGYCVRALAAIGQGYAEAIKQERKELMERSAKEGNLHEGAVRDSLVGLGYEFWGYDDSENVFELQVIPGVIIRGHTDGQGRWVGEGESPYKVDLDALSRPHTEEILLEVKTMSTKQFAKWQLHQFSQFPKYASQISAYMAAFPNHDVIYVVKRREDGLTDIRIIPFDRPPIQIISVKAKILMAEKHRRHGGWPKCDLENTYFCDYWYLHDEEEDEAQEDFLTEEMEFVLGELVTEYLKLKEIEVAGKDAESKRKKLNPEILNMLGKLDQANFSHDGTNYRVTRGKGGGESVKKDELRILLGDEWDKYVSKYRYEYPLVKTLPDK